MRVKLEDEIKRLRFLQSSVLGTKPDISQDLTQVDVKAYAKHIIKHGTIIDKRELLGCLKSKLLLNNKLLSLQR
jgi:hypothetical protein